MVADMARPPLASSAPRPPFDWAIFSALAMLMLVSAYGLAAADWADHLALIPTVAVIGVVAGTALGQSRFPGWLAAIFASAYGAFLAAFLVAGTLTDIHGWHDRLVALGGRLASFARILVTGEPNNDPLMFVLLMALVYWAMAVVAGYLCFRKGTLWWAVLPSGIALMINVFYYLRRPGLNGYVAAFALTAVLLLFSLSLARHRREWRRAGTRVPSNAPGQIAQIGIILAVVLVVLAWGVPSFAQSERASDLWASATRPWARVRHRLTQAFSSLRNPVAIVSDVFGDQLRLAAAVAPAETPVLTATVLQDVDPSMRFYWRARTYDTYQSGTWSSLQTDQEAYFPDDGSFPLPPNAARVSVEVSVDPHVESLHLLYVPAQPSGLNRSSLLTVIRTAQGLVDVSSVAARTTVVRGEIYRVRGEVANPTAEQLRSAGDDYPAWVRERFLQLPEDLTPRTRQLAVEITRGLDNPYDRAAAITRWLRDNIQYSLESYEPPEGVEPIDWFLFDHGVGFCNWYATSEVLLLRSLGVPARLAAGFAQGTVDESGRQYLVRQRDAHAWPEVYFPGYGWVEFEPTSAQPPLQRLEVVVPSQSVEEGGQADVPGLEEELRDLRRLLGGEIDDALEAGPEIPVARPSPMPWLVAASLLLLAGLTWLRLDPVARHAAGTFVTRSLTHVGVHPPARWARYERGPMSEVARVYWRWVEGLGRIGIPVSADQTPFERGRAFARQYPLEAERGWTIAQAYAAERFGGVACDAAPVQEAWRALGPWMLLLWLEKAPRRARARLSARQQPPAP
jgi:transglutaminase-like putative cysteine protease